MNIRIFKHYIRSWLTKDLDLFLSVLTENVQITKCYGAQYFGKKECKKWFSHWFSSLENQVISWEIHTQESSGEYGFFTWTFECVYNNEHTIFDGISRVKFKGDLICEIYEFEMTHKKQRPYSLKKKKQ